MSLEKYRPTMTSDVLHSWAADAQAEINRLTTQLAECQEQLQTTQLQLMSEETDRKIWQQDCKKCEAQLAERDAEITELKQLQIEIVESAAETQKSLRAEVKRLKLVPAPRAYVKGFDHGCRQAASECLKMVIRYIGSGQMALLDEIKSKFGLEG